MTSQTEVVRRSFACYLNQDREAAETLIADGFVFTSPQDDHIDRATYFAKCFPTADRFDEFALLHVVPTEDDEHVLAVYEYGLADGERYRNAELYRVADGKLHEVEVFFGGRTG